jgi:hypothetical protein
MKDSVNEGRKDRGLTPAAGHSEAKAAKEGKKTKINPKINTEITGITHPLRSEVSIESSTEIEVL